jgi:hypothetical protein
VKPCGRKKKARNPCGGIEPLILLSFLRENVIDFSGSLENQPLEKVFSGYTP